MRCIFGLCVVLAAGSLGWSGEQDIAATRSGDQTPAATPASPAAPVYGTPTTAPMATNPAGAQTLTIYTTPMSNVVYYPSYYRPGLLARIFGVMRPRYIYSYSYVPVTPAALAPAQTYVVNPVRDSAVAQATYTPAAPAAAPTTASSGSATAAAQPATPNATAMPTTTFTPMYYRTGPVAGLLRMARPRYFNSATPASPAYSAPAQSYSTTPVATYYTPVAPTYYATPAQGTYMPVRRGLFGLGLFQRRWRQPVFTASSTPVYTSSGYYTVPTGTSSGVFTPGTINTGSTPAAAAPTYTPTMLTVPNRTPPTPPLPSTRIPGIRP
jgi:hypothetical protein